MAQPIAIQAEVQVSRLTAEAARRALSSPVEASRRGEVRSITLTIPLLSDRNSYLVVRLPDTIVQDLMRQAREVPEPQRREFITDWVMRNQEAVLEQYIAGERTRRSFRYNVVPVRTPVTEAVPRRVDEEVRPQPARTTIIRPRAEPQPQAPVAQPPQAAPPQQEDRRRTVPPQPQGGQRPVVSPPQQPPPQVAPPRQAEQQLPPLPPQITGGNGSQQSPYVLAPALGRARGNGIDASELQGSLGITLEGVGTISFRLSFTASQLSRNRIQATRREAMTAIEGALARYAVQHGVDIHHSDYVTARRDAMHRIPGSIDGFARSAEDRDPEIGEYIRTH
ncbi:MAG: hypothetical protein U0R44_03555 [Candidatus Micrarchaeia archaeon]